VPGLEAFKHGGPGENSGLRRLDLKRQAGSPEVCGKQKDIWAAKAYYVHCADTYPFSLVLRDWDSRRCGHSARGGPSNGLFGNCRGRKGRRIFAGLDSAHGGRYT
jgi:hypothetical protein